MAHCLFIVGMGQYQYFQCRQYRYRQGKNVPILESWEAALSIGIGIGSIGGIGKGQYRHIGKNVVSAHP